MARPSSAWTIWGLIAPGKSADFIVLDANPLDDITNTRRIAQVYLRGTAVDRARLASQWTGTDRDPVARPGRIRTLRLAGDAPIVAA